MPQDVTLRRAQKAAELLGSEAFKDYMVEREEEIKASWAVELDGNVRELLWQELQALYMLQGRLEADVQAPILEAQTEKRLGFDQRI